MYVVYLFIRTWHAYYQNDPYQWMHGLTDNDWSNSPCMLHTDIQCNLDYPDLGTSIIQTSQRPENTLPRMRRRCDRRCVGVITDWATLISYGLNRLALDKTDWPTYFFLNTACHDHTVFIVYRIGIIYQARNVGISVILCPVWQQLASGQRVRIIEVALYHNFVKSQCLCRIIVCTYVGFHAH